MVVLIAFFEAINLIADFGKYFVDFPPFNLVFGAWNLSQTFFIVILYILATNQPMWLE